jgi:hypothetical protein
MKEHQSKENKSRFGQTGSLLGFVAACLLALAMALGVTAAVYGNFDYNLLAGFNRQTKQKVWKIEARYSNSLIEEKTEDLAR